MRLFTRCTCESGKCDLNNIEVGSLVEYDPTGPTITESTQALSTLSGTCMTNITTNSIALRTTNESRLDWPEFNHLPYYLTGNSSSCFWFVLQESPGSWSRGSRLDLCQGCSLYKPKNKLYLFVFLSPTSSLGPHW